MQKKMADSAPIAAAQRVSASCSFIVGLKQSTPAFSHSGAAGVHVFEPGASQAILWYAHAEVVACDA